MAINGKLDPDLSTRLRDFLKKNQIESKRIVIDVESETVELDEVNGIEDI